MMHRERLPDPQDDGAVGAARSAAWPHADAPEIVFEAVLSPHQSLDRRGLLALGIGLGIVSGAIALRCLIAGAWPVMAFSVVEVSVAFLLLAIHRRQKLRQEVIRLNESEITVVRTDPYGRRRSVSLPAAWVQVRLEKASGGGGSTRLWLRSHGRGYEVGAFLHDPDRESLCSALKEALNGLRHPTFHNQQLLEC